MGESRTYCATHPNVQTNLRCGKCGKPICPRCLVHTPVGARCRECANLRRLPIFEVSSLQHLKAGGVGLGVAIFAGVAWALILAFVPFPYLPLIVALGVGYAAGELISLSANRKRSLGLQIIAGSSVFLSYVISSSLLGGALFVNLFSIIGVGVGIYIAVGRVR